MKLRRLLLLFLLLCPVTLNMWAETADEYIKEAVEHFRKQKFEEALESLNYAVDIDPYNAEAYFHRAIAYYNLEENEDAIEDCTMAITLNPRYQQAYEHRMMLYLFSGNYKKAILDATYLIEEVNPDEKRYYLARANATSALRKFKKSLPDYNRALQLDRKFLEVYFFRSLTYIELGRFKEAIKDTAAILKYDPKNAGAYYSRGQIYYRMDKQKKALKNFNKAIKLYPGFSEAYARRNDVYLRLGMYDKSLEILEKMHEKNPGDSSLYSSLANIYTMKGEYRKAKFFIVLDIESNQHLLFPVLHKLYVTFKISKEEYNQTLTELKTKSRDTGDEWEQTLASLYLNETGTEEVLEAAGDDKERLCEAYFYIGLYYLIRDEREKADTYFKLSKDTNIYYFFEYIFSEHELQKVK